MRWSNFFEDFDSQWEGEDDGAELDERRELLRADRSTQPFRSVIASYEGSPIAATVPSVGGAIHLRRLGANWVDGVACATRERVLIPLIRLDAVTTRVGCDCSPLSLTAFNHVTVGAALRELERSQQVVSATHEGGGANGVIAAVWKDALSIRSGSITTTIQLSSLQSLIVHRS